MVTNEALERVRRFRALLEHPTAASLDQGLTLLAEATGQFSADAAGDRSALEALRRELLIVSAMLNSADAFHRGWAQILNAALAGYTERGEPAVPSSPARISVEA